MRTLHRYHWRGIFVLWAVVLALTLPLVAVAAAPTPVMQRNSGADAPAPIDNLEDVQKAVVRIEADGA